MANQQFNKAMQATGEYGLVIELRHPLAFVRGLPGASIGEIVLFDNGENGQVTALKEESVEVLVFSSDSIKPGTKAVRSGKQLSIQVGNHIRGQVLDALGRTQIVAAKPIRKEVVEERDIDITPPHISSRRAVTRPLFTGTSIIDLMLPLGQGQREAILGDPTTGKNSFLLTTMRAQSESEIVIYAAIGKPWNDIKKVHNFITQLEKPENVVMVSSSAEDPLSYIFTTPFTAMTIAEYFRDAGENVLVILDDLSTHAKFYREMGLIAKRFPARESYPGDIFYVHARLLERGGNFTHPEKGEVSITCLPIAETVKEDFTGYIVSNLISITDGHLFFDEEIFSQGRRPAVNVPLSVTRVGGHTQTQLVRQLHRKLSMLMNKHSEALSYTHFGAELPADMQRILEAGNCLNNFLSQPLFSTVPYAVQVVLAAMIWQGWLNEYVDQVDAWRRNLIEAYNSKEDVRRMLDDLLTSKNLEEFTSGLKGNREALYIICREAVTLPKN